MIFFQLIFLICITALNYIIHKKNLLSPAILISLVACFCTCFCIINYNNWDLNTYNVKTMGMIILVVISFSVASFLSSKIRMKKNDKFNKNCVYAYNVSKWFTIMISIITTLNTYMYFREIYRIANVAKSMYPIKSYSLLWYVKNIDTGLHVNSIISNLTDVGYVIAYIYIYMFIYNVVSTKRVKPYILYLVPITIYAIQSILFGGRTGLLQMITLIVVLFYYILAVKRNLNFSKMISKYLGKIMFVLILVLLAFRMLNNVSGRGSSEMSLLYYISVYIGSGMKNLDTLIQDGFNIVRKGFGWETFAGIYNFLKRFTNISYDGLVLEFQPNINGLFLGNVYTAVRRYYYDFGWIGVIVIPFILGCITTFIERNCRKSIKSLRIKSKAYAEANCILYGIFAYGIVIFFIEDFVFLNIISVDYFLKITELYIINVLLIKLGVIKRNGDYYEKK